MILFSKINLSTGLGATITWYDFAIFNIAIALVFPKLFFPDMGPMLPILAFAVGFLARPLGSLIFGIIGDRLGRKHSLVITLLLTGVSTVAIGLLPTYAEIGILATVLLVVARILQTAAVGGEYGAASTMLVEHNLENNKKSFISSFVTSGFAIGNMMASLVFFFVLSFGDSFFVEYGWRIPFLLSAVLLLIGVYMRSRISETPVFVEQQKQNQIDSKPLTTVVTKHFKPLMLSALAISLAPSWTYGVMVFGVGYMVQTGLVPRPEMTQIQLVAWLLIAVAMIGFGWLGDKINRYKLVLFTTLASVVLTYPIFYFIAQGNALYAMLCLTLVMAPAISVAPVFFCEMFPANVRQTGSGLSYNLGLVFSAVMAIVSQQILSATQDIMFVANAYLALTVIALIAIYYLKKEIPTESKSIVYAENKTL
jgi:MHS family shikimate/dehydroshikimate transporter-like MFS transporter